MKLNFAGTGQFYTLHNYINFYTTEYMLKTLFRQDYFVLATASMKVLIGAACRSIYK